MAWSNSPIAVTSVPYWSDADGTLQGRRAPADPNVTLIHWRDEAEADRWARYAQALLRQATVDALKLDTPVNPSVVRVLQQAQYVWAALNAIAQFYNCLTIAWHTDPEGRQLYRHFLAGAPYDAGDGSGWAESEFSKNAPYSRSWFVANDDYPVGGVTSLGGQDRADFLGVIPAAARARFLALYDHGAGTAAGHANEFVQACGLYLDASDNMDAVDTSDPVLAQVPDLYQNVQNRAFVRTFDVDVTDLSRVGNDVHARAAVRRLIAGVPGGYCFDDANRPCRGGAATALPFFAGASAYASGAHEVDIAPELTSKQTLLGNAAPCSVSFEVGGSRGTDDWRFLRFDEAFTTFGETDPHIPLKLYAPLRDYLPWLRAWADVLVARGPQQAVVDARTYVAYRNNQSITQNGDAQSFLNDVMQVPATAQAEMHASNAAIGVTTAAIQGLGVALAGETYGISAVVAGVASLVLTAVGSSLRGDVHGLYRDDVGRWKPSLERGWIDNTGPASASRPLVAIRRLDASAVAALPPPPVRTRSLIGSEGMLRSLASRAPTASAPSSALSSAASIVGGLALGVGLAYAAVKALGRGHGRHHGRRR